MQQHIVFRAATTGLTCLVLLPFLLSPALCLAQSTGVGQLSHVGVQKENGSLSSDRPDAARDQKSEDNQRQAAGQAGPPTGPSVILDTAQTPQKQDPAHSGESRNDGVGAKPLMHEDAETTIANFTIALAIATIVLSLSTIFLWWETRKLAGYARLQSEDTKKSIEIAETASRAAVVTASSTRAWITFSGINPATANQLQLEGLPVGSGIVVIIQFSNTGASPALNLRGISQFKFLNASDNIPDFPIDGFDGEEHETVVGPNAMTMLGPIGASVVQLQRIEQGTHKLVFWTKIVYKDIYNPTVVHETQTCSLLKVNGTQMLNGIVVPNLQIVPVGPQNTCT